jgi:DNA polymerase-4
MDAFYASIEQRDDPSLRGRPVIVGGSGSRGVVAAASYEAREYGVHSAMSSIEAKRRCPHAVFVGGSMKRYAAESREIFEIFRRFTPVVQGLSLDEAFLDLTGSERLMGTARRVAERLRIAVREERNLAVSVGIAPVKMVAKIASDLSKPDGLLEVAPDGLRSFLDPLPVRRIWGVGSVGEQRLHAAGFQTIGDLMRADVRLLERRLGAWGVDISRLGRGQDLSEVEPYREPVSFSEENTFAEDVSERRVLESAIVSHAESVARRLRRDGLQTRTVVLKLKLSRRVSAGPRGNPLLSRRATLAEATDDGETIAAAARDLLSRAALEEPVRLLGVAATGLDGDTNRQLGLFPAPEEARRGRLNRALDEIADRFGSQALVRGEARHAERAGLSMQHKRGDVDSDGAG